MTKIATGRTRPDPVAELAAWIERLEAALAPLAAGDGSDAAAIDQLARTVGQGWAVYDRLPEDPRGDQLIMLLQRANALMAAVEDVLRSLRLERDAAYNGEHVALLPLPGGGARAERSQPGRGQYRR